jgi:hypothetical protein
MIAQHHDLWVYTNGKSFEIEWSFIKNRGLLATISATANQANQQSREDRPLEQWFYLLKICVSHLTNQQQKTNGRDHPILVDGRQDIRREGLENRENIVVRLLKEYTTTPIPCLKFVSFYGEEKQVPRWLNSELNQDFLINVWVPENDLFLL